MGRGSDNAGAAANHPSPWVRARAQAAAAAESVEHDHSMYLNYPYLEAAAAEMELPVTPEILVAGDIHGNLSQVQWLAARAQKSGASVILQVGDLGYWPHTDPRFVEKADKILARAGVRMVAIDGNHENFSALRAPHPDWEGYQVLGKRILYAPRGTAFEWHGKKILCVGGAHSVDKGWRRSKETQARKSHQKSKWLWWPEEDIEDSDVAAATQAGPVDILVSHDAPASVRIPDKDGHDVREDPETMANRQKLQRVIEAARPKLILHGHYHRRYTGIGGGFDWAARVEGLDCDGAGEDSALVLDLRARLDEDDAQTAPRSPLPTPSS